MSQQICIDVALVHHPVVNKRGEIIGSAITNLDLHDIARTCRTYGVNNYWVITPFEEQQKFAETIVSHWVQGYGSTANPDRGNALSLIKVCSDLDGVVESMREKWGEDPLILTTCAKPQANSMDYGEARQRIKNGGKVLLVFGTAWGLAPEVLDRADAVLPPIYGTGDYNHLSVRSAAAIILDRLLGSFTG